MSGDYDSDSTPAGPRIFIGLFSLIPLGIGITVLTFLWGTPQDEFGAPPLFFRLFGSFIALAFVLVGIGGIIGAAKGKTPGRPKHRHVLGKKKSPLGRDKPFSSPGGYVCGNCAATLQEGADVSPSGDVKCSYCKTWFNIHT